MEAPERKSYLRRQLWIKMVAFIGTIIAGLAALLLIKNLLLSFVVAVIISYLLSPLISYLEGTGLSRIIAILLVYCFIITLTGIFVAIATPFLIEQLTAFREQLPQYVDGTVKLFERTAHALQTFSGGIVQVDIGEKLRLFLTDQSATIVQVLPSAVSSSAAVLFLSPLLGFFLLKDGRQFARAILKLVPNNIFELTLSLQHEISEQIAHYLRARLLESLIVGFVCWIGFLVLDVPFAFLLAAFAAIANLIPYVGPLFGAAPGLILGFVNQMPSMAILLILLIYVLAQIIDNLLVIPLVVARVVNLHPVTVILVVLLGAQVLGILGMFISIPVASAIKVTFRNVYSHLTDHSA